MTRSGTKGRTRSGTRRRTRSRTRSRIRSRLRNRILNRQHDEEAGLRSQTTETTDKGVGNRHQTSVAKNKQRLDTPSYVLVGMLQGSARTSRGPRPPNQCDSPHTRPNRAHSRPLLLVVSLTSESQKSGLRLCCCKLAWGTF